MRTKTVRILNIVAGILLIAAGIYCLCNEDVAVLSAGLMLGIFMLAAGIAEIVVFAGTSGVLIGSGWLFYCFRSVFPAAQMPARISATDRPMRIPEKKSCTSVPPVVLDMAPLAMPDKKERKRK